jgi:hypothetical protein
MLMGDSSVIKKSKLCQLVPLALVKLKTPPPLASDPKMNVLPTGVPPPGSSIDSTGSIGSAHMSAPATAIATQQSSLHVLFTNSPDESWILKGDASGPVM